MNWLIELRTVEFDESFWIAMYLSTYYMLESFVYNRLDRRMPKGIRGPPDKLFLLRTMVLTRNSYAQS